MKDRTAPWPPRQLLRDIRRRVFYTEGGGWTDDPERARDFPDIRAVLEICDRQQLRDVELVEYFGRELTSDPELQNQESD